MALMKWGDDEEKDENLFQAPTIKTVNSVQSSWQPTQQNGSGGATDSGQVPQGNYLLSEEKAQVDQQKRMKEAAEAARQAQIAEQSEIARRQQAQEDAATKQLEAAQVPAGGKYTPVKEKKDEGVWGFIKDVGAGIQQGIGAVGDIAIQGGGLLDYAGNRLRGQDDTTAALNMQKNTDVLRNWLHGQKDFNGTEITGTRDVEDSATRINNGTATLQDYAAISGKGLQAGIDSTMFLNPARLATKGIPGAALVDDGANLATRVFKSPAVQYAARDATFFGGLQGTATFQSVYGQTGDFEQAMEAAIKDAVIGATVQGTLDLGGNAVNVAANRTLNSLRRPGELTPVKELIDAAENADGAIDLPSQNTPAGELTPVIENGAPTDGNVSFQPIENSELGQPTNLLDEAAADPNYTPVADGVATPVIDTPGEPVVPSTIQDAPVVPETPITDTTVAPVADGIPVPSKVMPETTGNMPVIKSDEVRALQEAKAGASQADEAAINQELNAIDAATPRVSNLPDDMNTDITGVKSDGSPMTPEQVVQRTMPKLDDNQDVKQQIASAVGMDKDIESPVRDILREGGIKEKQADRVATEFETLEKQLRDYNSFAETNQKAYIEGGAENLSDDVSRDRSRIARDMGTTQRRLMNEINRMEASKDKKIALINNLADIIGTRNASVLTSAGLLERNIAQEITANLKLMVKNPGKMLKSTFDNGNILGDTAKSEASHWKDAPGFNPVKITKYVVGNTYRTAMIPTTALANTRRGAVREELTRWVYKALEGRELSSSEAKKLAGAAGNEMEALVNTFIGVDNGMTNRKQATEALQAWKEYMRTGDDGAKAEFMKKVEAHNSLADQMINGLSKDDQTKYRALKAMGNLIFPFVRTATNLAKNTVRQDLNPMAKSLLDEIRADQRSGGNNAINLIKSKLVDYGIMGGAAALATSGVLVYNDGDDVDKPQGWSLKLNDNQYVPVRATALELPIALAGTAQAIARDVASGKPRDWTYYAGMVTKSLPYIDQINTTTGAVDSLLGAGSEDGDGGYAIKSYGVNMAKSLVPFSNNGVQPYVEGKQNKSLNAKTSYDKDIFKWLENTVRKSYDPDFYNTLKDSRDNAGRVRTVDNQGVISNKQMNDADTAEFNDDITQLVKYGRENGLGKNTEDMFNSYDTGKNNNFKGIQDSITFLDVTEGVDGKKTPKNEDKLKKNPKLTNLSQQIRDGFFGESGDELLTLDGKNLYSDVSAPNSSGSKNSRMPISMQSIKNAIAQTDLPEAERNRIYEISQGDTDLYNRLKAKEITYEQYSAEKAKTGQEYINILSNSESYKKMSGLFDELDNSGFFEDGGMGSTRSGQTYLWNSLNALLGSKGATPAANYPDNKKFTPYGSGGGGTPASFKPGDRGEMGVKFTPVTARQQAETKRAKFTPLSIKVKLGNEVKKNKTQNYADKTF